MRQNRDFCARYPGVVLMVGMFLVIGNIVGCGCGKEEKNTISIADEHERIKKIHEDAIYQFFQYHEKVSESMPSLDRFNPNNLTGNNRVLDEYSEGLLNDVQKYRTFAATLQLPEDFSIALHNYINCLEEKGKCCAHHPTYDFTVDLAFSAVIAGLGGDFSGGGNELQEEMRDWGNRMNRYEEKQAEKWNELKNVAMRYNITFVYD